MAVTNFKDLIVWQKAMELAKQVYMLTKYLPQQEIYALSDQMRRAAVSIPSNIAEGQARQSKKEFLQFLSIARGSRAELETQLLLAKEIGLFQSVAQEEIDKTFALSDEVGKMLFVLSKKLTTDH
ncbi:MAG: four helix bundle protein [Clostridia bacterium]|nr:four helix bundle protein [Clostridia bacterium]